MDKSFHRFTELFEQLGLCSDVDSIRDFIARHAPLAESIRLEEAPFWTPAQVALLREGIVHDADWAEVIDQLSLALRVPRSGT